MRLPKKQITFAFSKGTSSKEATASPPLNSINGNIDNMKTNASLGIYCPNIHSYQETMLPIIFKLLHVHFHVRYSCTHKS